MYKFSACSRLRSLYNVLFNRRIIMQQAIIFLWLKQNRMLIVSDAAWADILIEESTNREVEDT